MQTATVFDTLRFAEPTTDSERAIQKAVRAIPSGKVASFEHVARKVGTHARAIGNAAARDLNAPMWRVVRKDGTLTWEGDLQVALLTAEGVKLIDGKVDPANVLV